MIPITLQHSDDPRLGELSIPFLALADDYTLLSTSHAGLQWKLQRISDLCNQVQLSLNPLKCVVLAMGAITARQYVSIFSVNGTPIPRRYSTVINGYHFQLRLMHKGWDCNTMVVRQTKKFLNTFRVVKSLRHELGLTTPLAFLRIYRTLVEAQLQYAQEISFDTSAKVTAFVTRAQKAALRFLTGVHPRSMTSVLFRDLLLLPIPLRAVHTAAKYLQYATSCPPTHPLHHALKAQSSLRNGWLARLRKAVGKVGVDLQDWDSRIALAPAVETALWNSQHQALINTAAKWPRMLAWSFCPSLLDAPKPAKPAAYLSLPRALARACARFRTSTHNLSIERYRIGNRRKARHNRTCPSCPTRIEDEFHLAAECPAMDDLRRQILPDCPINSLMQRCLSVESKDVALFLYKALKRVDQRYT